MATRTSKNEVLANSLTTLTTALGIPQELGTQLSQTATLVKNNRSYFITNDRTTLTYAYTTHGIIQTLIDQPIEDAFRGGIDIISSELDSEEIQNIQNYIKENDVLEEVKDLAKWTRLYGGGGMIINTVGKAGKKINIEAINEHTNLSFEAADRWELQQINTPAHGEEKAYVESGFNEERFFYYGTELDQTRVLKTRGKRAPSLARPQLRGWGMSEVERLVRSLNQYLKNNDLIFELLDEAKIDVYGIKGFNTSLATKDGTKKLTQRVQMANTVKNYQQAIVKDKDDDYDQKQMNFAGLSEMLQQIRIGIASDLKMPLTKLFGMSTAGFSSGEDEIENYNSMIESEIRGKYDNLIIQIIKLISQKLFGLVPDDLQIKYKPLRILSAVEEEQVKTSNENRILAMYDRALMTSDQVIEEVNQTNLFATDLENESRSDFPMPAPAKPKMDIESSKTTNSFINKIFKKNGRT